MAWTDPSGLTYATGDVVTATNWNAFANNFAALENAIGLYGGQLSDGSPIGTTEPIYCPQVGVSIVTTGDAGGFSITMPNTFPTGVLCALAVPTGNVAGFCRVDGSEPPDTTTVTFNAFEPGGSAYADASALYVHWLVVGY